MVTTNDEGLRPDDLMGGTTTTSTTKTTNSRNRNDIIGFDVFKSAKDEEEETIKTRNDKVRELLKKRADSRKEIRKSQLSQTSQSQKDRRTSLLVDLGVQMLNDKGISSGDLQPYLEDPEKGMELIKNMQSIDNGKYSGEIDNYINGLSPDDGTGLFVKMYPDYAEKFGYSEGKSTNKAKQVLQSGEGLDKDNLGYFTEKTELGRTLKKIGGGISNLVLGAANELVEFALGGADLVTNVAKGLAIESPDSYLDSLTSKQGQERYNEVVNAGKYKGSYEKWVEDAYNNYEKIYNETMNKEGFQDKYENWRDTNRLNWYDEDAPMTQVGEMGTKVAEWFGGDALATKVLNRINKGYKTYKGVTSAQKLKGIANVGNKDIVAAGGAEDLFKTLSSKTERDLAGNIFDKLSKAFAQSISEGGSTTALSRALEGIRMGTTMQGVEDIRSGELSKPGVYAVSALANSILNVGIGAVADLIGKTISPSELIQRSVSRIEPNTVDKYTSMAKRASVNSRAEHPLMYVTKKATQTAGKRIDEALASEGAKLGNIRKNLPQSNLNINDALSAINKGFQENNMGIRIVGDAENGFKIEGVTSSSDKAVEGIVNKINSLLSEYKFKLEEGANLPNNTQIFENLYTAIKRIGRKAEKQDKPMFQEIESNLRSYLDEVLGAKAGKEYADALSKNAELYSVRDVANEVPGLLNKINSADGGGQALLSNGMSLTEYLDYLEKNGFAPNLIDEREIAAYLQAYYGVPISNSDRVVYPSLAGLLEKGQNILIKAFQNPEGNALLRFITPTSKTVGRPFSARGKGYEQPKREKTYGGIWDAINKTLQGKAGTYTAEAISEAD